MKRACKANLSLAIALTIASSVGQYAMAESRLNADANLLNSLNFVYSSL